MIAITCLRNARSQRIPSSTNFVLPASVLTGAKIDSIGQMNLSNRQRNITANISGNDDPAPDTQTDRHNPITKQISAWEGGGGEGGHNRGVGR